MSESALQFDTKEAAEKSLTDRGLKYDARAGAWFMPDGGKSEIVAEDGKFVIRHTYPF